MVMRREQRKEKNLARRELRSHGGKAERTVNLATEGAETTARMMEV